MNRRAILKAGLISGAAGLSLLPKVGTTKSGSGKSGSRKQRSDKDARRSSATGKDGKGLFFGYVPFTQECPKPPEATRLTGGLGRDGNTDVFGGDSQVLQPRPAHYGENGDRWGPSVPRSVERSDENGDVIPGTGVGPEGLHDVANGIAPEYGHFGEMVRPDLVYQAMKQYGTDQHAAEFGLVIEAAKHRYVPNGPEVDVFTYRDIAAEKGTGTVIGPTVVVQYREPAVVRCYNLLTGNRDTAEWGGQPNNTQHAHETSIHLHGGHNPAHSDGYPDFYTLAGEARDYWYTNCGPQQTNPESNVAPIHGVNDPSLGPHEYKPDGTPESDANFDQAWIPTTLWYHDHAMDVTGFNVSQGLVGLYIVYDEREQELVKQKVIPEIGGDYDIGLAIRDERFNADGSLFYDKLDHNGHIGDVFLVNGKVQPYLEVEQRKYRFRILGAGNARVWELRLSDEGPTRDEEKFKMAVIATDSWMLPELIVAESLEVSSGMRHDVIIDFAAWDVGEKVYLENIMIQTDGRKPKRVDPNDPTKLLQFRIIEADAAWDGDDGRPLVSGRPIRGRDGKDLYDGWFGQWAAIESREIVESRVFRFDRGGGAWTVNNRYFNPRRSDGDPQLGYGAERWTLANNAGGWVHPCHTHLEGHQVRSLDGVPVLPVIGLDESAGRPERRFNQDLTLLHGGERAELWLKQRTFTGPFVMHCHTIEHEDMRMMVTVDPQFANSISNEDYGLIQDGVTLERIDETPPLDGEHEINPEVSGIEFDLDLFEDGCFMLEKGEYLYFEAKEDGVHLFDTAQVDRKGVGFMSRDGEMCDFDMRLRGNRGRIK